MDTIIYTGRLVTVTCWCGIHYAIPESLNEWANKAPSNAVYCPLGHEWVRRETEAAKLRKQLERERSHAASLSAIVDQETARADHEAARARGYKGALTKTKKRIGRGVCPACNRHFANVERHMSTRHPDFESDHVHG